MRNCAAINRSADRERRRWAQVDAVRCCGICGGSPPSDGTRYHLECYEDDRVLAKTDGDACRVLWIAVIHSIMDDLRGTDARARDDALDALHAPGWTETICDLAGIDQSAAARMRRARASDRRGGESNPPADVPKA